MTNKNTSSAMRDLLRQSAMEKEKQIQQTNSVVENQENTVLPTIEKVPEVEDLKIAESVNSEINIEKSENKKFSNYLNERKIKVTEVIRVSKDVHLVLKRLSLATGVSMHIIASNILEEVCNEHKKEIQNIIKKYMNI